MPALSLYPNYTIILLTTLHNFCRINFMFKHQKQLKLIRVLVDLYGVTHVQQYCVGDAF